MPLAHEPCLEEQRKENPGCSRRETETVLGDRPLQTHICVGRTVAAVWGCILHLTQHQQPVVGGAFLMEAPLSWPHISSSTTAWQRWWLPGDL